MSLISSFITMVFNKELTKFVSHDSKLDIAWFDARAFGVPIKEEAYNAVMWRARDCVKNSKGVFAQTYCSHKSLLNKHSNEQIGYCLKETGKNWNQIEDRYKYGILVKRENYEELDTRSRRKVTRTKIVSWSEKLTSFDETKVELIARKLINEG